MMGATPLISRTGRLGYGKNDTDSHSSGYSGVPDGRTQLYSGNPIQMYINEDDNGPNSVEEQWAGLGRLHDSNNTKYVRIFDVHKTTGTARSIEWNDPDNAPSGSISTYGPPTVGGTDVVLSGTAYDGTYAVDSMADGNMGSTVISSASNSQARPPHHTRLSQMLCLRWIASRLWLAISRRRERLWFFLTLLRHTQSISATNISSMMTLAVGI